MTLIYSTDTTTSAITTYNNMLTGGTFDISTTPWTPYSGYSVIKIDNNNSNSGITTDSTIGGFLLAGVLNTAQTNSDYVTIFGGSGNTVDFFNNKIFAGENNIFKSNYNPLDYVGINFDGSSIIMGGNENNMIGLKYLPEISTIMNGSGNTINNRIQLFQYSDDYKRNTIINGLSNTISGIVGNSWIGNGSGNTIQSEDFFFHTTHYGETKGNYILNGHDNIISSTGTTNNYNTIIGGYNNSITNINNSIIIGSNLIGSADTTSVNNMFFTQKIFANNYSYLETDGYLSGSFYTGGTFYHNNKLVGIIKLISDIGGLNSDTIFNIENGSYVGQILFLIGIPAIRTSDSGSFFKQTRSVVLSGNNIVSLKDYFSLPIFTTGATGVVINNIMSDGIVGAFPISLGDGPKWSGLGIFVWDGNYWIRADYRGGI